MEKSSISDRLHAVGLAGVKQGQFYPPEDLSASRPIHSEISKVVEANRHLSTFEPLRTLERELSGAPLKEIAYRVSRLTYGEMMEWAGALGCVGATDMSTQEGKAKALNDWALSLKDQPR